jgi:hypothetical protein
MILLLSIFDPVQNQEKKKSKIQEDIHEDSLEDCPSWW